MAVPPQQRLHRPILEFAKGAGDEVLALQEIRDRLAHQFLLSKSDLAERVSSGQNRFTNRVYWAVSYLKRAGMLESPSRACFRITRHGLRTLETHPGDIEVKLLQQLIDSRRHKSTVAQESVAEPTDDATVTPDEQFAVLHSELNDKLADELLDSVRKVSPSRFEQMMVRLLEEMGYGEGRNVGGSGDGGIDGVMSQDVLGLEKVYVQAKRWGNRVGEPEIRNFSGSLQAKGASKGVFVTTSTFGPKAKETAERISAGHQFIRLIDGEELARLMISHDVGVLTETTYLVKKLDENYFTEEL